MFKKIYIVSDCDDGHLVNGNSLSVEQGSINMIGPIIRIVLNDDGKIIIQAGNYELLSIDTDCGDFVIDLPNCHFNKIKLKSDCGDMKINTNYNQISFDTDCGEYENLNLHNKGLKPTPPIGNKMVKKVKSLISDIGLPLKNKKDRYY